MINNFRWRILCHILEWGRDIILAQKCCLFQIRFTLIFSEWSRINALYEYKNINEIKTLLLNASQPERVGRLLEVMERQLGHKVLASIEDTKIKLSTNDMAQAELEFFKNPFEIQLFRKSFEEAIAEEVKKSQYHYKSV